MFYTKEKIKEILQITETKFDDLIDATLKELDNFVLEFYPRIVVSDKIYLESNKINFDSTLKEITLTDTTKSFIDLNFIAGQKILVRNSFHNDGVFTIANLTDSIITVSENLIDETKETYIKKISAIEPKSILLIAYCEIIDKVIEKDIFTAENIKVGNISKTYGKVDFYRPLIKILGVRFL